MTTTIQAPPVPAAAALTQRTSNWRRTALVIAIILVAIAATYAFAWYNAKNLSAQYLSDADTSYQAGKYLDALVGSESFDQARNSYVTKGGYLQVEKIWSDAYSWPQPADYEKAKARTNEIINQRITLDQAEQFVEANTGKKNPYFGVIYLRLGELYEKDGDKKDAQDIYSSIPELFPGEADLVAQAKDHLARLTAK